MSCIFKNKLYTDLIFKIIKLEEEKTKPFNLKSTPKSYANTPTPKKYS